jgi:NAD-dependent histone deacetylase SIR2
MKCTKTGGCDGIIKPSVVFFGENLPSAFTEAIPTIPKADLCVIIGTGLAVSPFNILPSMINENCDTILLNMDKLPGYGDNKKRFTMTGPCDEAVHKISADMGWSDELKNLEEGNN